MYKCVKAFYLFFLKTVCICTLFTPLQSHSSESITYALIANDWHPLSYVENGSHTGLLVDIAKMIFQEEMNVEIVFNPKPWKRAQREVRLGHSDFLITVATEERRGYAVASLLPLYQMYMHVYTYQGHPKLKLINKIRSVDEIKQLMLRPVSNLGNGWHKSNIDDFGIDTIYVREDENIVRFLAQKRADIMIEAKEPMNYMINRMGLSDKVIVTNAKFGPVNFHLLMSKKSPYVTSMPKINTIIKRLVESGAIANLAERYE